MKVVDAAVVSATVFAATKALFIFIGWYTRDQEDRALRRNLDSLVQLLDSYSALEIARGFFQRLVRRIKELGEKRRGIVPLFLVVSFLGNLVTLGLLIEGYARLEAGVPGTMLAADIIRFLSPGPALAVLLVVLGLAVGLDLVSLWVTWTLVKAASRDHSLRRISAHVALDLLFIVVVLGVTLLLFLLTERVLVAHSGLARSPEPPGVLGIVGSGLSQLSERPGFLLGVIVLGVSSALPTVLYMLLGGLVALVWVSPSWLQHATSRLVFLVTTDGRPVFAQLGTLLGVAGSVTTFCIAVATPSPTVSGSNATARTLGAGEEAAIEVVLDQELRSDASRWGFRRYKLGSVSLLQSDLRLNSALVEVSGEFLYTEFGRQYRIEFWGSVEVKDGAYRVVELCWRTLGGYDCVAGSA